MRNRCPGKWRGHERRQRTQLRRAPVDQTMLGDACLADGAGRWIIVCGNLTQQ